MAANYYGHDKDGHPVFYQCLGTLDTHGILHSASRQDIIKYTIRICEDIQRAIRDQRQKVRPSFLATLNVEFQTAASKVELRYSFILI